MTLNKLIDELILIREANPNLGNLPVMRADEELGIMWEVETAPLVISDIGVALA